jgi:hypothetical protein
MAHLVIDRALDGKVSNSWPRWEEMLGNGTATGFVGAPKAAAGKPGAPGLPAGAGQSAAAAQSSAPSSSTGTGGAKSK